MVCTVCHVANSHSSRDYQEIKVQELIGSVGVGSIPRSVLVVLTDDLVDSCKAGDDVVITGLVKRRWKNVIEGEKCGIHLGMVSLTATISR